MVTMADVANIAGVSVSTVSHVVNGTRTVRSETRAAVLAAIEQTGYQHNTIARALVTASTRLIGLSIPAITNPYFADIIHAIERNASAAGYTMLLTDSREDPDYELRAVQALLRRRVDGMIIVPAGDADRRTLAHLIETGVPTVLVDRLTSTAVDQVGPDNVEPTAHLVSHLAELGHRRIGMVAGQVGLTTTDERIAGYRRGLARHGLPYDPDLVRSGGSQADGAHAAARALLSSTSPPTALVVGNNLMTIGAMRALREEPRRVPEDVALVCFDDFDWADLFAPRLTTMAQPRAEMGDAAMGLLMRRLADPTVPARTLRLAPQFMHRDSCGCTAGAATPPGFISPDSP